MSFLKKNAILFVMNTSQSYLSSAREVGQVIAKARKTANISQEQMAELLGVDRRTISAYEQGRCRIHATALLHLSRILNISLDDLSGQEFTKIDGRTRSAHAIRELDQLPEEDQKLVFGMIDSLASKQTVVAQ